MRLAATIVSETRNNRVSEPRDCWRRRRRCRRTAADDWTALVWLSTWASLPVSRTTYLWTTTATWTARRWSRVHKARRSVRHLPAWSPVATHWCRIPTRHIDMHYLGTLSLTSHLLLMRKNVCVMSLSLTFYKLFVNKRLLPLPDLVASLLSFSRSLTIPLTRH